MDGHTHPSKGLPCTSLVCWILPAMPPTHIPPWPGLPHRWGQETDRAVQRSLLGPEMGRNQRTPPKCSVEPSARHLCRHRAAPMQISRIPASKPFPRLLRVQNLSLKGPQRPHKAQSSCFPRPGFSWEYLYWKGRPTVLQLRSPQPILVSSHRGATAPRTMPAVHLFPWSPPSLSDSCLENPGKWGVCLHWGTRQFSQGGGGTPRL